jgi:hypothetical protein
MFKRQLHDFIEQSKSDKKWRKAAANAITILVRAGVQFIRLDLRGIQIPGADLSYGMFESARLEGADLRDVDFRGVWLGRADLSKAKMAGVQFGELPFLKEESEVTMSVYSLDGGSVAVALYNGQINLYSISTLETLWRLFGHSKEVTSIVFSRLAAGITQYGLGYRDWNLPSHSTWS